MSVEQDCPVCTSSESAMEQFTTAKVAEHIREKARRDDKHHKWIDSHTENGPLAESRAAHSAELSLG